MRHDPALFAGLANQVKALLNAGDLQPLVLRRTPATLYTEQLDAIARSAGLGLRVLDLDAAEQRIGARFDANGTYLITGGFGGFGLQMANWLVGQGVRHLALVGRNGAATPEAKQAVASLQQAGANVYAAAADIADDLGVQRLLQSIAVGMPPLKGVFHAAAVLDDAAINVLEARKIEAVMQPKALGAWLLHQHTRYLPLDYFVLFSSVGSLVGNPGQAPYVSANAFLDALAQHRSALNLPATAINWGALGQVGMAARSKGVEDYLNRMGFGSFTPSQAIGVLDKILDWKPVNIGAAMMDWQSLRVSYPNWAEAPRNSRLFAATADGGGDLAEQSPLHALRQLEPAERQQVIEDGVLELVSTVLRVNRAKIDTDQSLLSMGMDSLMGIELQGVIERRVGIKISTLELMKGNALAELIVHLTRMAGAPAAAGEAGADGTDEHPHASEDQLFKVVRDLDARLSALSDAEIDKALEEFLSKEEQV
jgi:acyl carrier protein